MTELNLIDPDRIAQGLDSSHPATQALIDAAKNKPVPAIEMPLGRRVEQIEEVILEPGVAKTLDSSNLGGLRKWNNQNPWQY